MLKSHNRKSKNGLSNFTVISPRVEDFNYKGTLCLIYNFPAFGFN